MINIDIDRFNDRLLAFVVACLFCGAINKSEFRSWCVRALSMEGVPGYIYDLIDFDDEIFKIYEVIGYVPSLDFLDEIECALYGIAISRGLVPYDMPVTPEEALSHLHSNPGFGDFFNKVFGFIGAE